MNPSVLLLVVSTCLLSLFFIQTSEAVCPNPLIPSGTSTVAPPVLNTTESDLVQNQSPTNANDTRLFHFQINWPSVQNRIVTWAGIGARGACDGDVKNPSALSGGWTFDDTTCTSTLTVDYFWPQALYSPSCSPQIATLDSDNQLTISFDLIVEMNETLPVSRAGNNFNLTRTITSKLPVQILFPKNVTVQTNGPIRVFSASSVQITANLIQQSVVNNPPYLVVFQTLVGSNFDLTSPALSYTGGSAPFNTSISRTGEELIGTANITRQITWSMLIFPGEGLCDFDGDYSFNYTVFFTGSNSSLNPIPDGSTAQITFTITSEDFCAKVFTQSLTGALKVFDTAPLPGTIYAGFAEKIGFLTRQKVYFQGQVFSPNVPLATTSLAKFWVTYPGNSVDLIVGGSQVALNIQYANSTDVQPADQVLFNMILDEGVFSVAQDQNIDYTFNALLIVTYRTAGKRKREVQYLRYSKHSDSALISGGRALRQVGGANPNVPLPLQASKTLSLTKAAVIDAPTTRAPVITQAAPTQAPSTASPTTAPTQSPPITKSTTSSASSSSYPPFQFGFILALSTLMFILKF